MDLLFMLIPDKYEPYIIAVAVAGFFTSEGLSLIPWFKSNGVCQAIANIFRSIVKKFRPELITEKPQEVSSEYQEQAGAVEQQRIVTPELTDEQRNTLNQN